MALKARHMKELQDFQNQMHEEIKERAQALGSICRKQNPYMMECVTLRVTQNQNPKSCLS